MNAIILNIFFGIFATVNGYTVFKPKHVYVNCTIRNDSVHKLNGVELHWSESGSPVVGVGILWPGIFKSTLDFPWPNLPDAKLFLIDYDTPVSDYELKKLCINVSFAGVNEKIMTGKYHSVTIRILDYDKAVVVYK